MRRVQTVGAGAPPRKEEGQANGLEGLGGGADGDSVDGALLREELSEVLRHGCQHYKFIRWLREEEEGLKRAYSGSGSGHVNQSTEVGSALIAESASGVDESTNTVGLEGGADQRGAPGDGGRGSLLGLDELLGGVGDLGAAVGLAEERGHNC
ncbi:hypothetical protein PG995_000889 [Apiospora arundinis]